MWGIIIGIIFLSVIVLLYGGVIVSSAGQYKSKKRYYFGIFIALCLIIFSLWMAETGFLDKMIHDIFFSNIPYSPGECFPYGSCN
jgi:hypothetical protein